GRRVDDAVPGVVATLGHFSTLGAPLRPGQSIDGETAPLRAAPPAGRAAPARPDRSAGSPRCQARRAGAANTAAAPSPRYTRPVAYRWRRRKAGRARSHVPIEPAAKIGRAH